MKTKPDNSKLRPSPAFWAAAEELLAARRKAGLPVDIHAVAVGAVLAVLSRAGLHPCCLEAARRALLEP
jgi:hypothetical protein